MLPAIDGPDRLAAEAERSPASTASSVLGGSVARVGVASPGGRAPRVPLLPVVAAAAFAVVAVAVERGGRLVGLDHRIAAWLSVHRTASGERLWLTVVGLGEPSRAPVALLMLAVVLAAVRRSWAPLRTAGTAVVALAGCVLVAKTAFGRLGPGVATSVPAPPAPRQGPLSELLDTMHQGAFPSGHTTTAVVTWSVAVVLLRGRLGRAGVALVGSVALLVAFGLVYTGFHWLSDVLGALPFGVAITWVVLRISPPGASRTNRVNQEMSPAPGVVPVTTRSRARA